jgi:hypothetical protein
VADTPKIAASASEKGSLLKRINKRVIQCSQSLD